MNKDEIKGDAKQVKGSVREKAGKATDDNETEAKGKAEQVEGKVQEKYGEAKDALKK
jgi:uncharacterized protein YjbJ (UPF0337 family)